MPTQISGTSGVSKVQDGVVVQADLAVNVAGNGPAFSVYPSGVGQAITSAVWTKVNLFAANFNIGNCFNVGTFRFTPNVAGYYQLNGAVACDGSTGITRVRCAIYKNGSPYLYGSASAQPADIDGESVVSDLVYLNGTTDYVELWAALVGTSPIINQNNTFTRFSGFLARTA